MGTPEIITAIAGFLSVFVLGAIWKKLESLDQKFSALETKVAVGGRDDQKMNEDIKGLIEGMGQMKGSLSMVWRYLEIMKIKLKIGDIR